MKIRDKNPVLKGLIESLEKKSLESKTPAWKAVARNLNRPRRGERRVNLYTIEKHAREKESILVPGTVLGSGELTRPLHIAALRFSKQARERIEKAGGKCLSIEELVEKNPKGAKLRILG